MNIDDECEAFWDFSKPLKKSIDIRGTINNRVKYDPSEYEERKVDRETFGTEYAKEFVQHEEDMIFQSLLNEPGPSAGKVVPTKFDKLMDLEDVDGVSQFGGASEATLEIYKRYTFNKPPRYDLPIVGSRQQIIDTINDNKVTIITAATGTGKTTQVPQYVIDDCFTQNKDCNIIITQPRRIAAMTIAKRVADERGCELGTLVGYQVGLHKKLDQTSHETRILYCTTGILLQKLVAGKNMIPYTHIFLDEVHERDADMDFLLIVVRKLQASNSPNTKLILMSATIKPKIFSEYFKCIRNNRYQDAPVIEIKALQKHDVRVHYLDNMRKLKFNDAAVIDYNCPGIMDDMYKLALKILIFCLKEADDHMKGKTNESPPSILVFLPGLYEIECFEKLINDPTLDTSVLTKHDFKVVVMHSSLSPEDQKAAFQKTSNKKIILATNIAESSITLPDVRFIIDFCLTKYLYNDSNKNLTTLELNWTSKSSCGQRAGRAGRVCEGDVYRLVHKEFFERKMHESCIPEMRRCPLENMVLKAKLLDMGSPTGILALALDPPNKTDILNSILILKEVGALLMYKAGKFETEDGELTYVGRIMSALPINVHLSKLIVMGYLFSVLDEAIQVAAGLNIKSIFKQEYNRKLQAYSQKLSWADGSGSDAIGILNAYKSWLTRQEQGNFRSGGARVEKEWCDHFQLEIKNLYDMKELIREINARLDGYNMKESFGTDRVQWTDKEKPIIIKICIAAAFFPNYFLRATRDENMEREIYASLSGQDPFNTVYFSGNAPKYVMEIYEDTIKQKFYDAGVCTNKDRIKVVIDNNSTKIFVSFLNSHYMIDDSDRNEHSNNIVAGRVLVEVYKALKHRRVAPRFSFMLMDEAKAQRYAVEMGIGKFKDGVFSLENYYINFPECCVLPSVFTATMEGKVTHVEHPSKFFFLPMSARYDKMSKQIEKMILACAQKMTPYDGPNRVPTNTRVLVRVEKNKFIRGRVVRFHPSEDNEEIRFEVYLIDEGGTFLFKYDCLYPENEYAKEMRIFDYPPRVFETTLCKVQPSLMTCPKGKWTTESIAYFKQKVEKQIVKLHIYSVVNDTVSAIVTIQDENINDSVVDSQYGQYCEENFVSKMNHDERMRKEHTSPEYRYGPDIEFRNRIDRSNKPDFPAPGLELCRQKLTLVGPFSPLETEVHPLTRFAKQKTVQIDPNSVNSIVLNCEPQERHEKLFVAASVSDSRGTLTLRETTSMPSIPGLTVLLALLFSPVAEIRRSADQTRYVNVLTGLGFDPQTKKPHFAEHDAVFRIDVNLNEDDFKSIGHLRYLMNHLLFTEPNRKLPNLSDKTKSNAKLKIKDTILKLLTKDRVVMDSQYSGNEFDWGNVDLTDAVALKREMHSGQDIFIQHAIAPIYNMKKETIQFFQEHNIELKAISNTEARMPVILCKFCSYEASSTPELRLHLLSKFHQDRVKQVCGVSQRD